VKILMVHNFYQQRAGESAVFEAERRMLLAANHTVVSYTRDSKEIDSYGGWQRSTLALQTIWAHDSHREIRSVIARESPDVAHFTNTFPLISPSAYYACRKDQVPVVQSIHNYRLVCPAATLWRNGAICEECVNHSLLRSVRHACYRQSRSATAVLAAMLSFHRSRGTYVDLVDRYIALTEFARDKLVAGGIPKDRIAVKSNFAEPDPGPRNELGHYALFAGRLTDEKGTHVLLDAWKRLDSNVPLRVAGDGPQREQLERRVTDERIANVTFLGALPAEKLMQELRGARVLVFPSRWYEGMPMSIVEAFACGVPTIASRLGGMREMIEDGRTGLLVAPADAADLAAKVSWAFSHDAEIDALGRAARAEYEAHYTAASNCARLIEIYRQAIEQRRVETP
jgi:glycosyltransferase involved in cell wall biosynthesis